MADIHNAGVAVVDTRFPRRPPACRSRLILCLFLHHNVYRALLVRRFGAPTVSLPIHNATVSPHHSYHLPPSSPYSAEQYAREQHCVHRTHTDRLFSFLALCRPPSAAHLHCLPTPPRAWATARPVIRVHIPSGGWTEQAGRAWGITVGFCPGKHSDKTHLSAFTSLNFRFLYGWAWLTSLR